MRTADAGERLARAGDRRERDHSATSLRGRSASATRSASSAAARSSTARPSDTKHGQVVGARAARRAAAQHLAELGAASTSSASVPSRMREQEVARLVERRLARVDDDARGGHGRAVELARRRDARADGVHVRAGREPARARRSARARSSTVTTTSAPRSASSTEPAALDVDAVALGRLGGERLGGLGAARVDAHALERQHAGHRLDVRARLRRRRRAPRASRRPRVRARGWRRRSRRPCGSRSPPSRRATPVTRPSSPSKTTTTPWCASRPRVGFSGKIATALSPNAGAPPARCAVIRPIRPGRLRRPHDRAQREVELARRELAQHGVHRLDAVAASSARRARRRR